MGRKKIPSAILAFFTLLLLSVTPTKAASFTFGAAGDFGPYAATGQKTFQKIGQYNPNLFFAVGDFQYNKNPETIWCQMVKDNINIGAGKLVGDQFGETYPFELITGDHEDGADNNDGLIQNFVKCLPDRIGMKVGPNGIFGYGDYYIDYPPTNPNTRIIALAPLMQFPYPPGTFTFAKGDVHYNWASQTIDDARAKGIKWIVVMNHENYITMGIKGNGIGADFFNLMLEKKIDLLFEGNDHNYQRSKQIALNGSTCTSISSSTAATNYNCIVDDGSDNNYQHGKGMILVITGTGGIGHYDTNPLDVRAPYFAKWMGNTTTDITYGYTQVSVTDTALNVNFVRSAGGNFTDAFSISDTAGTPSPLVSPTPTIKPTATPMPTLAPTASPRPTATPIGYTPTPVPTATNGLCQKMFIPAYFYPGTLWTQAISSASKIFGMIMNPNSGPGTSVNSTYVNTVNSAKNAGIKVYGYVHTSYGARAATDVKAEIDMYKSWYNVTDIFFDETPTSATYLTYYQDISNYVHQNGGKVVLNPGTTPDERYLGFADIIMNFENTASVYQTATFPSWINNYPASRFVHLVYDTPDSSLSSVLTLSQSRNAGYVYITNDILPNPWDTLPSYMSTEINALCAAVDTSVPGDTNSDAKVNGIDYVNVIINFNKVGANIADVNKDGVVNLSDLEFVVSKLFLYF